MFTLVIETMRFNLKVGLFHQKSLYLNCDDENVHRFLVKRLRGVYQFGIWLFRVRIIKFILNILLFCSEILRPLLTIFIEV